MIRGAVCPLELAQNTEHNYLHRQVTAPLGAAGLGYSDKSKQKGKKHVEEEVEEEMKIH